MIIRVLALDPWPEPGRSDILVFQVPENSREYTVLIAALDKLGVDHTKLTPAPYKKRVKKTKAGAPI